MATLRYLGVRIESGAVTQAPQAHGSSFMPRRAAPSQISGTIWLNSSFGTAHPRYGKASPKGGFQILTEGQGLAARGALFSVGVPQTLGGATDSE